MTKFTTENDVSSVLTSSWTVKSDDGYQVKMDYLLNKVNEMKNSLKMCAEFFSKFSLEVTSSLEVMELELNILKKDKVDKEKDYGSERSLDMMTSTAPENNNHSLLPNNSLTSETSESDLDENILVGNETYNYICKCGGQQASEVNSHCPRDIKPYIVSNEVQQSVNEIEVGEEFKSENLTFNDTPADHLKMSHSTAAKSLLENSNLTKDSRCKESYSPRKSTLRKSLKLCNQTKTAESSLVFLSCDFCEYKTDCKQNLSLHMQKKHLPKDPNMYTCRICKKIYRYKLSLQKHSKLCNKLKNSKRFSSDYCDNYKPKMKSNLGSRLSAKHLPRESNSYKCSKCKKTYSNNSGLWYHLKICGHSKNLNRPTGYLFCDHCTYKCKHKHHLASHIQSKHSSDTFKCTACGKSFVSQDNLRHHAKYSCKILVTHKRLSCDLCTYKCSYKSHLIGHIHSKHFRDSVKCAVCGKSYKSQYCLNKHNNTVDCKNKKLHA